MLSEFYVQRCARLLVAMMTSLACGEKAPNAREWRACPSERLKGILIMFFGTSWSVLLKFEIPKKLEIYRNGKHLPCLSSQQQGDDQTPLFANQGTEFSALINQRLCMPSLCYERPVRTGERMPEVFHSERRVTC